MITFLSFGWTTAQLGLNSAVWHVLEAGRCETAPPDSAGAEVLQPRQSSLCHSESLSPCQAASLESFSWIRPSASQKPCRFPGRVYSYAFARMKALAWVPCFAKINCKCYSNVLFLGRHSSVFLFKVKRSKFMSIWRAFSLITALEGRADETSGNRRWEVWAQAFRFQRPHQAVPEVVNQSPVFASYGLFVGKFLLQMALLNK